MKTAEKEEKKCFICGATKNLVRTECCGNDAAADVGADTVVKLKLELKHTKIKRVITIPGHLSLLDLNNVIQAMFGFENDHLWNFKDDDGNEYNTCRDPMGGPLDMDVENMLDPEDYTMAGSGDLRDSPRPLRNAS